MAAGWPKNRERIRGEFCLHTAAQAGAFFGFLEQFGG